MEKCGGSFVLTGPDEGRLDPAVVAGLYEEYGSELRAFLTGVLRDSGLAGDALQSTFVKAVERGHSAQADSLKGWLFRVAYHEAMAIRRRQKLQKKSQQRLAWNFEQSNPSPEETVVRREQIECVRAAMDELPPEQRQVVHMRIYDEKTFAVIAEELELPLGTVLTRMRLALRKLARNFDADL